MGDVAEGNVLVALEGLWEFGQLQPKGVRGDMASAEPMGVEDSANERQYMAGTDHVSPKCRNMSETPQTLPSFEQKTLWKTYNIWSITCCALIFCKVYSSVFVEEGQSFFSWQSEFPLWQCSLPSRHFLQSDFWPKKQNCWYITIHG